VIFSTFGTVTNQIEYTLNTTGNSLVIPAGAISGKLIVTPVNDNYARADWRFIQFQLVSAGPFAVDTNVHATIDFIDDDAFAVRVKPSETYAAEPTELRDVEEASFSVEREGTSTNALTVSFTLTGSAINGADYQMLATSVVIPPNETEALVTVKPLSDLLVEGVETVILTIQPNANYSIDPNSVVATNYIEDRTLPVISIVATDDDAREAGQDTGTFRIVRAGIITNDLTVYYRLGGTATLISDYSITGNPTNSVNTLTALIPTGVNSVDVTVTPVNDGLREPTETVVATIAGSFEYRIGVSNSATVYIDDSSPTEYSFPTVLKAAAITDGIAGSFISPGVIECYRTGSSVQSATFPYGFNLTVSQPVNPSNYSIRGDITNGMILFTNHASKAHIEIEPTAGPVISGAYFTATNLPVPNGNGYPIHFLAPDKAVKVEILPGEAIEGGSQSTTVRFSRFVAGSGDLSANFTIGGFATPFGLPGQDHNVPSTYNVVVPGSGYAYLTFTAYSDAFLEGWESIAIGADPFSASYTVVGALTNLAFIREPTSQPELLPESDTDGDGLPDRFEIQYGFDPLKWNDATLDQDKDGLSDLEEALFKLNPTNAFTFGNGISDFHNANGRSATNTNEVVPIKLAVGDFGKVNNGQNCAVCHTTRMQVGDAGILSLVHGQGRQQIVEFEKGKTYPIRLIDLVQNLPPTGASGSPTTTARYTATLTAVGTNTPEFAIDDPSAILGVNKVWNSSMYEVTTALLRVPHIEMYSTKAATNPPLRNPQPFVLSTLGYPFLFEDTNTPMLVIYYKDVVNANFQVQSFDVKLRTAPGDVASILWTKDSGPNSGTLSGVNFPEATYGNPSQGGVYQFFLQAYSTLTKLILTLPPAGAEIKDQVWADLQRSSSFVATVKTKGFFSINNKDNLYRWFYYSGAGDYQGRPDSAGSGMVRRFNQVNTTPGTNANSKFGAGAVATWFGVPVRVAKASNFMVGYGMVKIGVLEFIRRQAQTAVGTKNDPAGQLSWDAGEQVAFGGDYTNTVAALVRDIFYKADVKNQRLWPNPNALDNHVARTNFNNADIQFTSPGFIEMQNP
jgi:hypothetical protein